MGGGGGTADKTLSLYLVHNSRNFKSDAVRVVGLQHLDIPALWDDEETILPDGREISKPHVFTDVGHWLAAVSNFMGFITV